MGIQGLLPLLKAASNAIHIKEMENSTAIIDAYCWLHRAVYYCAKEIYYNLETTSYVEYCIHKINVFKKYNIKCILVFDGLNLPSKSHTELARRKNREKIKLQVDQLLESGQVIKAEELMKRCIDISWDMAKNLINACRKNNIDYIVAPYEADAQIAYLIKHKLGHFVITEDSDLLLFGCDYVVVKLDHSGNGVLIRQSKIFECLGPKSHNFNFDKFRQMCILSGCDYLPSLPGIGLKKSLQFFGITMIEDITKALKKIPSYLKMKNLKINHAYIDGFIRSENTFKYQIVFDPIHRKLVPLNPYSQEVEGIDLSYAGEQLDEDLALQLALGNVDIRTMSIVDNYQPDLSLSSSIWSKNYQINSINPLEKKFEIDKNVFSLVDDNLKQTCSANKRFAKKLIIDKSSFEMYSQDQSNQEKVQKVSIKQTFLKNRQIINSNKFPTVRSRYFIEPQKCEVNVAQTFPQLVETKKEKEITFISNSSSLSDKSSYSENEPDEENINFSFKSSLSSSPSSPNNYKSFDLSSNNSEPKTIAFSLNKFAFKRKRFHHQV